MSKKKIDETMTAARQAREKRAREKADQKPTVAEYLESEGHPDAAVVAAQHAHDADAPETTAPKTPDLEVVEPNASDAPTEAKEDLVVFAMRVTQEERDAIHKAAGPGKASRFVRQIATAAARGDVDAIQRLIDARVK